MAKTIPGKVIKGGLYVAGTAAAVSALPAATVAVGVLDAARDLLTPVLGKRLTKEEKDEHAQTLKEYPGKRDALKAELGDLNNNLKTAQNAHKKASKEAKKAGVEISPHFAENLEKATKRVDGHKTRLEELRLGTIHDKQKGSLLGAIKAHPGKATAIVAGVAAVAAIAEWIGNRSERKDEAKRAELEQSVAQNNATLGQLSQPATIADMPDMSDPRVNYRTDNAARAAAQPQQQRAL